MTIADAVYTRRLRLGERRMIYVIGTNHNLQHTGKPTCENNNGVATARKRLELFLNSTVKQQKIELIAEELSDQYLKYKRADSIARIVALENGILHKLSDPDCTERKRIGVPWRYSDTESELKLKYDVLREQFWLDSISNHLDSTILFICGEEHVEGFTELLDSEGLENRVLYQK